MNLIRNTDQGNPFNIIYVEHPLTDSMLTDTTPVVTVMDYKSAYEPVVKAITGISAFRGITFKQGSVKSRVAMTATCDAPVNILKRGQKMASLSNPSNLRRAYAADTFLPIKPKKYDDVIALLSHVTLPPEAKFYSNLRPGGDADHDENDVE